MKTKLILSILFLIINIVSYSQTDRYLILGPQGDTVLTARKDAGDTNFGTIGLFSSLPSITSSSIYPQGMYSTYLGWHTGYSVTTGSLNTIVGSNSFIKAKVSSQNQTLGFAALQNHYNGNRNTAIGAYTMLNDSSGAANTFIGNQSGYSQKSGVNYNVGIGVGSLYYNKSGSGNTAIGTSSLYIGNYTNCVAIGYNAGYSINTTKGLNQIGQIKLGYQAGSSDTANNTLFIENSNSQTPLIGGKFDEDKIGINKNISSAWKANLNVGGTIHLTGAIYQDLLTGSLTDGAPTTAEINAITGLTPSISTAGFTIHILDSDGTGLIYDIISDGTSWQYIVRTKSN